MYRVCVIGAGDRGTAHATTWAAREDSQVVAVCDLDESRRHTLAGKFGATAYERWEEALCHEAIDIVSVCPPTHLHAPVIVKAAELGLHIMAEKPLALTHEQAVEIEEALASSPVVYTACFQHRDRGVYRTLKRLVDDGRFGSPIHFRFTDIRDVRPKTAMHRESRNGGVVIDMACHMFDMLRFLTGDEVVKVAASGDVFGSGKARLAGIDDLAVDAASIELTTERGHRGSLYINWGMPEGYVAHRNGFDLIGPLASAHELPGELLLVSGDHREFWPDSDVGSTKRIASLVDAVESGAKPEIGYRDARITHDLSIATLESIRTGAVVEYTPFA